MRVQPDVFPDDATAVALAATIMLDRVREWTAHAAAIQTLLDSTGHCSKGANLDALENLLLQ